MWVYEAADDRAMKNVNGKIFQNEQVGLALKRFECLKLSIESIDNETLRKEYLRKAPAFLFFSPDGEQISEVTGKAATSLSGFSKHMNRTWTKSYRTNLKDYARSMARVLDQMDRLDAKKQILARDKVRLAERPNARKQQQLEKEQRELDQELAKVTEDEQKVLDSVKLRPEYLPKDEVAKSN